MPIFISLYFIIIITSHFSSRNRSHIVIVFQAISHFERNLKFLLNFCVGGERLWLEDEILARPVPSQGSIGQEMKYGHT
jgi:hypothetical protein